MLFVEKNLRENRLFASEWTVGEKYSAHNVKFHTRYFTSKQPMIPLTPKAKSMVRAVFVLCMVEHTTRLILLTGRYANKR